MVISGYLKQEDQNLSQVLRMNKIFLNKNVEAFIVNCIKETVNLQNECKHNFISLFYQLSSFYNFVGLRNEDLDYIYRWFTKIAKTKNFQQLDFNSVNKILSSSEFNISSEL